MAQIHSNASGIEGKEMPQNAVCGMPSHSCRSLYSIVVYLNDCPVGGGTALLRCQEGYVRCVVRLGGCMASCGPWGSWRSGSEHGTPEPTNGAGGKAEERSAWLSFIPFSKPALGFVL